MYASLLLYTVYPFRFKKQSSVAFPFTKLFPFCLPEQRGYCPRQNCFPEDSVAFIAPEVSGFHNGLCLKIIGRESGETEKRP